MISNKMRPQLSALIVLLVSMMAGLARAEVITVYTSANFAPLVVDDKRGLYPDLVNYLNRQKLGNLSFKLSYLPRKRLQVKLEEGSINGIIIGMMPQWFDDAGQTKYLWTAPFGGDNFILVSNSSKPVNPGVAATLPGTTIGLTLGYVYPGIDQWIAANGLLRNDALSEEKNIEKLLLGRVDCIVVSQTVINYYVKINKWQGRFQFGHVPGQLTERRFLIPHSYKHVHDKIAPVIKKLDSDPAWQKIAEKY
jgi:polar amino acid transport system substrate-binding protein